MSSSKRAPSESSYSYSDSHRSGGRGRSQSSIGTSRVSRSRSRSYSYSYSDEDASISRSSKSTPRQGQQRVSDRSRESRKTKRQTKASALDKEDPKGSSRNKGRPAILREGSSSSRNFEVDVRILSAKNLRDADSDGTRSDPYCVCEVSGATAEYSIAEYRERMTKIYEDRMPRLAKKVDFILDKYAGQENFLYLQACHKYDVPLTWDGRSALPPPSGNPAAGPGFFRTDVVDNKLDPVWNYSGHLTVREGEALVFRIRDQDQGDEADDELGFAVLSWSQIKAGFDGELQLYDPKHKGSRTPSLQVRATPEKSLASDDRQATLRERTGVSDAAFASRELSRPAPDLLKPAILKGEASPQKKLTRQEREENAIGKVQARFRGILERMLLRERKEAKAERKRQEQEEELLKEIAETCPAGSCSGYGFQEQYSMHTGSGPTRGFNLLPLPEGTPGPKQVGGILPQELKAARPETPFGNGLAISPPSVARTAAGRLPSSSGKGAAVLQVGSKGTMGTAERSRRRNVGQAGPALLAADTLGRGEAQSVRSFATSGQREMPAGLSEEEAMQWKLQALGAQLRAEAVEKARVQSQQNSRVHSRASSPRGSRLGVGEQSFARPESRSAGIPPPKQR
eukprot:TRINITY_DN10993_c0_g1_i1.p1 TRINITY_DN10993_c0_g1~~TRINITY_DN10993_c0_g1_i1.p1  ORF type:complete len:628 (+),score=86.23 TRINITY_DN10993_c0_g1_i1:40-1923(+)